MIARLARVAVLLSAAVLVWVFVATAQSDPFVGAWRLNVAKSKYSPGPTPKSITSTYEAAGQGYKVSVTNESATGKTQYSYATNLDGKDSPVTGTNANADTVTVRRIDPRTLEVVSKKGGKVTITQRNAALGRWQVADGHDDRHGRTRAESQQRRGLRETVVSAEDIWKPLSSRQRARRSVCLPAGTYVALSFFSAVCATHGKARWSLSHRHARVSFQAAVRAQGGGGNDTVPVELSTIGLDGRTGTPIVVLRDPASGGVLPVWIGAAEAQAIALALHGVVPPRPMTHDLMASLISELRAEVEEVVVTDLRNNTYFGIVRLRVAGEKKIRDVDSRPSDALALALRTGAPIRVARKILAMSPEFEFIAPEGPNQVVQALGMTVVIATPSLRKEFRSGGSARRGRDERIRRCQRQRRAAWRSHHRSERQGRRRTSGVLRSGSRRAAAREGAHHILAQRRHTLERFQPTCRPQSRGGVDEG